MTKLSSIATKIMPTGLKEDCKSLLKLSEEYVQLPLIGNYVNVKSLFGHKKDEETSEV